MADSCPSTMELSWLSHSQLGDIASVLGKSRLFASCPDRNALCSENLNEQVFGVDKLLAFFSGTLDHGNPLRNQAREFRGKRGELFLSSVTALGVIRSPLPGLQAVSGRLGGEVGCLCLGECAEQRPYRSGCATPRRSEMRRLGDRCRERLRIRSCCLTRTDSATTECMPQGPRRRASIPNDMNEKDDQIAHLLILRKPGITWGCVTS